MIDFFLKGHKHKLIQEVNKYPNHSILEIGVGHGRHVRHYQSKRVTGIDISEKMLQQAKTNNSPSIKFIKMDGVNLSELKQKFDIVVLSHVLSTGSKANEIIESSYHALHPKGKIIILNHFSTNRLLSVFEKLAQPIANLFHFHSFFPLEKLTALKTFQPLKALKFGILHNYQLLIFEKT